MKNNGAVTGHEKHFGLHEKLISSTNLDGVIQHTNQAFQDISGFSLDELIGSDHNLVRHPEMPPEVFKVMWHHLKKGKPWMGLVKNRCKNGDHYWVNAYVTPVTKDGKVVGYESVRSCPSRQDVERAEKLYKQINDKKVPLQIPDFVIQGLIVISLILPSLLLGYFGSTLFSSIWLATALVVYSSAQYYSQQRKLKLCKNELKNVFMHPDAVRAYTNQRGLSGQLIVGIMSMRAHLDAVLTRIEDAAERVTNQSNKGLAESEAAYQEISQQTKQTDLMAGAMDEMTKAIHEISQNVQETASQAEQSSGLAVGGQNIAETTRRSIEELRDTVIQISTSVEMLVGQTQQITKAAGVIEKVSEKTNLLALNAAIEAARAGEHGRGFSVVADEVRLLAAGTKDSAQGIRQIVVSLNEQAQASVDIAQSGALKAEDGLTRVIESESMLRGITSALGQITSMSEQMAVAVEEQAIVSSGMNDQFREISNRAIDGLRRTEDSAESIRLSQKVSEELHELVNRFKQ